MSLTWSTGAGGPFIPWWTPYLEGFQDDSLLHLPGSFKLRDLPHRRRIGFNCPVL